MAMDPLKVLRSAVARMREKYIDTGGIIEYDAGRGPICYEALLYLDSTNPPPQFVKSLSGSGLTWYWISERSVQVNEAAPQIDLPARRDVTRLSVHNPGDLERDLRDTDAEGGARFIALFGISGSNIVDSASVEELRTSLIAFASDMPSALQLILVRLPDSANQLLFAPRESVWLAHEFLARFGVVLDKPTAMRRFQPFKIEGLLESAYPID